MRQSRTLSIGLDVPKDSMAGASVADEHSAEVTSLGTIGTRPCDMAQLVRTRPANATPVDVVYDAGPGGSWRSRDLTKKGHHGWRGAPSRRPPKAGDRVKPDRRDAIPLARLLRAGELTSVSVPAVEDEASRDLSRAREDAIAALKAATFRLKALWLRHESRAPGRATWGPAPLRWRAAGVGATPAQPIVCQEDGRAVHAHTARLQRRGPALQAQVTSWRLPPVVEALEALRGVPFPVAVTRGAELGDLTRVEHPRPRLQYRGLIPAEDARGARRRPGPRTTAGHPSARRARVDGAWASRYPAKVSRHLPRRLEPPPNPSQDISWKAPVRRGTRDRRWIARGQQAHQVGVAMARAPAGFLWAMANQVPVQP
jgi:transposase